MAGQKNGGYSVSKYLLVEGKYKIGGREIRK